MDEWKNQNMPWRCNKEEVCTNTVCSYRENSPYNQYSPFESCRLTNKGEPIYRFPCSYVDRNEVTLSRKKAVAEYKVYKRKEVK